MSSHQLYIQIQITTDILYTLKAFAFVPNLGTDILQDGKWYSQSFCLAITLLFLSWWYLHPSYYILNKSACVPVSTNVKVKISASI